MQDKADIALIFKQQLINFDSTVEPRHNDHLGGQKKAAIVKR